MNEAQILSVPTLEARAISDQNRGSSSPQSDEYSLMRQQLASAVSVHCPAWLIPQRDDIVQNAMMAVLRQKERQDEKREGDRDFSPSYLRKAAFTAMVDEIRRRHSRGEVPLDTEAGEQVVEEQGLLADNANPERQAISRETAAGLRECLALLAPPRRMAVTLHLLGYKVPQMAKKTGWNRKQAENLVYRGLRDLREHLRDRGLEP